MLDHQSVRILVRVSSSMTIRNSRSDLCAREGCRKAPLRGFYLQIAFLPDIVHAAPGPWPASSDPETMVTFSQQDCPDSMRCSISLGQTVMRYGAKSVYRL